MEEDIKCKYIFDDRYNPRYVNGAFGGITPKGEIVVNFFLERMALPNSQTFAVKDGEVIEEKIAAREPADHPRSFVRVVENGVVLDYQNAVSIHQWLGEQIDKLAELKANEQSDG